MHRLRRLAAALVAVAALASSAPAQEFEPTVKIEPDGLGNGPPGGTVAIRAEVELNPGFHCYGLAQSPTEGIPPRFHPGKDGWPAGFVPRPAKESPAAETMTIDKSQFLVHHGKVTFTLPFTVTAAAAPGPHKFAGELELQICDRSQCYPPMHVPFEVELFVTEPSTVKFVRTVFVPDRVAPGSVATLELEFAIGDTWHIAAQREEKSKPPKFDWDVLPDGWNAKGAIVEVTPPHEIEFFGEKLFVHEKRALLRQEFTVGKDAKPGEYEVAGTGSWQRCNEGSCVDDVGMFLAAKLTVAADGASSSGSARSATDAPKKHGSLGSDLLAGFLFGLVTVLTPCVFPLLPVTVSFFAKQKGPPLPRSLVYAAGMIFTITVIGLVFKGGVREFAQNAWFNLAVGVLFIALGLSLFGMFELRLPSFLIDATQKRGTSGGLVGPFFMAVTLALTSFSCSFPFLATMFTAFDDGEQIHAVLGLLVYSATVALPFFVCSLFPSLIQGLPKSGGWLNAVKVTMGFVEFALAFKFLRATAAAAQSDLLPRTLVLAIWIACCAGATLYLFGLFILPHDTKPESIGPIRTLFALVFLTLALYFLPGLFGQRLNSQVEGLLLSTDKDFPAAAAGGSGGPAGEAAAAWRRDDWDGALSRAKASGRPALFDLTAIVCPNCRALESLMHESAEVRAELAKFELMQIYIDLPDKELAQRQAKRMFQLVGTNATPVHVVLDADGKILARFDYQGPLSSAADYVAFLREGLAKFKRS